MPNVFSSRKQIAIISILFMVSSAANAADSAGGAATVATVNSTAIKQDAVTSFSRSLPPNQKRPDNVLVEELVNMELLAQQAIAKGLDKTPEMQADLENQRRSLLARSYVNQLIASAPVKDEDMQKFYKEQIVGTPRKEYKTRHILIANEADAKAIIAELDKGGDFAKLAKERSTDTSAQAGGDLNWIDPARMPPAFGQALTGLSKGSYTKTPVQSQFGWHIILAEDVRDLQPPPFDQVKDQIRAVLQNKVIADNLAELKKKSKIEIKK